MDAQLDDSLNRISAAKQIVDDADLLASIAQEFPLSSQTSVNDKLVLLKIRDIFRSWPSYNYVEIGSYLGGSLVPFCRDEHCGNILSIDDRGRDQPDERGANYDYTAITTRMMIDNLAEQGVPETRVNTFDGSISECDAPVLKYDLMMIDGEHTNWACFRDFVHGQKLLAESAIVMFHDTRLVFNALKIIREHLKASKTEFVFFKERHSDISFILLNEYCKTGLEKLFEVEPDIEEYERSTERNLAIQFIHNKTRMPRRLVKQLIRKQEKLASQKQ